MLARDARTGQPARWTNQERVPSLLSDSASPGRCGHSLLRFRLLIGLLLVGLVFADLAPASSAATNPHRAVFLIGTALRHSSHTQARTSRTRPLIEELRFNGKPLPFGRTVTVGPGAGTLAVQFTALTWPGDRLRYRLLNLDPEWKEVGKDRKGPSWRLTPGNYEFDYELAENGNWRTSAVESIRISVAAPYWQAGWFRTSCAVFLLLLILTLHKLRVRHLLRHAQRLQETVSQAKAEMTLAVKTAGDAQAALKEQALKDSLTGLWNRRALFDLLEREVYRAQRDRFPITLVMIDLDHFKAVNDTYGHQTGDDVLREAASRLLETMRPYDFAGRYGGEEFLVILPSCSPQNGIRRAEDFRRAIAERPVLTARGPLEVTCSLGVAMYDYVMPPEALIHRADEALYLAKRMGRNCVCGEKEISGTSTVRPAAAAPPHSAHSSRTRAG